MLVAFEEGDDLHGEIAVALAGPGMIREAEAAAAKEAAAKREAEEAAAREAAAQKAAAEAAKAEEEAKRMALCGHCPRGRVDS